MSLSLKKNFGFALIGNFGYALCQYIILLVFVKLFSTEDVGKFIYAGAFTTPLMLALEMQLRNFYVTDHENKLKFFDYNVFRLLATLLGVSLLGILAIIICPEYFYIIIIVALIKSFESQLDLIYGVYQKNHHLNFVAYSRIIRGVVAVIVVAGLSFVFRNIIVSLLGYLLSWFVLYYFYEKNQVVKRGFIKKNEFKIVQPQKGKMMNLISMCLPIFIAIFIDKYYLNYPRLSVEKYFGVNILAIFGSLLYFKSLAGQFVTSLIQAAMPKMAVYVQKKEYISLNKLLAKMIIIAASLGLTLTLVFYFFGTFFLRLLYTEEYVPYSDVLVVILLGTTVSCCYLYIGSTLTCIRKQWVRLPISIISFVMLFSLINFNHLNGLMDIAKIVLYVELFSLVMYLFVYFFFIVKLKKI